MGSKRARGRVVALALALMAAGCDDATGPEDGALFKVEVSGEHFVVHVRGEAQIQALQGRLTAGARGVINGRILAGDGGFNAPWGWHMDPETVQAPDASIELCDGRPSMVQEDLTYWLGTVKQFCPWGAKVVQRIR